MAKTQLNPSSSLISNDGYSSTSGQSMADQNLTPYAYGPGLFLGQYGNGAVQELMRDNPTSEAWDFYANAFTASDQDLQDQISSWRQTREGNCATVAVSKAATDAMGTRAFQDVIPTTEGFKVILRDGTEVNLTITAERHGQNPVKVWRMVLSALAPYSMVTDRHWRPVTKTPRPIQTPSRPSTTAKVPIGWPSLWAFKTSPAFTAVSSSPEPALLRWWKVRSWRGATSTRLRRQNVRDTRPTIMGTVLITAPTPMVVPTPGGNTWCGPLPLIETVVKHRTTVFRFGRAGPDTISPHWKALSLCNR